MQMRPEIQIKSILKSMTDVVLPAIDPENQLAQEQAKLCIGLLSLMASQLPLQFRFDCDELARLLALAGKLSEHFPAATPGLQMAVDNGRDVIGRARAEPDEVVSAVRLLRSVKSTAITQAYDTDAADVIANVQQVALDSCKQQNLRDRALLLRQGWEADPDSLPAIETLLAPIDGS